MERYFSYQISGTHNGEYETGALVLGDGEFKQISEITNEIANYAGTVSSRDYIDMNHPTLKGEVSFEQIL